MKRLFTALSSLMPSAFLMAQSSSPTVEIQSNATGSIDWVAEVLKGGLTSVILLFVGFVGIVFIIERLIVVRRNNFIPKRLESTLRNCTLKSDYNGIQKACEKDQSVLASMGAYIATHTHIPFEILSFGVTDMISRAVSRQHLRTYPLAVVATISPLLGLLGTIIGMIEAFQKVALMGDTGDASVLADSIGKALITTALGLIIAIPSLASYHYFKSKVNSFGIRLEETVDTLMSPWLHPEATKSAQDTTE
ncbi:MotA/TolQ/ExbB proton channel family protein [Coraliomargarita sp. SDUM461003]|uniref:MotA/TolQ/ExbB proton channel family protein n=1 Tax=Thalassobacterium maritimum TaxID=3041265 RepID=A0ABU1AQ80_9BACT|nr:MotA/TolQ/ExbB proton channel family protein [Coraliomargarita sp. SDUM461003]MDQ8206325.1 MotA/TolQ/ExbB proton channel family protein [Coraliomargarita sp. SDUM461003]